jgi:hypothetical protein
LQVLLSEHQFLLDYFVLFLLAFLLGLQFLQVVVFAPFQSVLLLVQGLVLLADFLDDGLGLVPFLVVGDGG